jgi:magnesium transporter
MSSLADQLDKPLASVVRRDVATLAQDCTVQQALDAIRLRGLGEKIVYFYVVDAEGRLAGVLPTRRLLTAPLDHQVGAVMLTRVVALSESSTVRAACDAFASHKYLAFPVVDAGQRLVGVVDVSLFTEKALDLAERRHLNEVFEAIGLNAAEVRDAAPLLAFRYRFPWLLATIGSGTVCALLVSAFAVTLAQGLVLAFFLTMVLGLAESVSIQSMAVTIQVLRHDAPTLRWYSRRIQRELATALLLGLACGLLVGLIVWLWQGEPRAAFSIGASLVLALGAACFFGLSVPALLHAMKLDPKISSGPVTLALTDIFTLLFYFGLAAWLL